MSLRTVRPAEWVTVERSGVMEVEMRGDGQHRKSCQHLPELIEGTASVCSREKFHDHWFGRRYLCP